MKLFINIERKYLFALLGLVFALLAPAGWFVIAQLFNLDVNSRGAFVYIFISTALSLGIFGYIVGYYQDILFKFLDQDSLTILLNQKAFFRKSNHHFQIGVRYKDFVSVIMMDIDDFKNVNDENNHLVGSAVLKKVAHIINDGLRETDIAARFGGDEFVICLPRTDLVMAGVVAERVRLAIEETLFTYKDTEVRVTASFGVSSAKCSTGGSLELLTERADHLLYKAKKQGKNRVILDTSSDSLPKLVKQDV